MISRVQWICLALLVAAGFALAVVSVQSQPETVPVHWNFRGEADRYGSPWELALIQPGFVLGTVGLLVLLAYSAPTRTLQGLGTSYGQMVVIVVSLMVAVQGFVIARGSQPLDTVSGLLANSGLLIAALGNYTSKFRRNATMGFRTPWTLKDDAVWERANRAGGRWMFGFGIAAALAALSLPIWAAGTFLLGGVLTVCLGTTLYSRSLARAAQAQGQ